MGVFARITEAPAVETAVQNTGLHARRRKAQVGADMGAAHPVQKLPRAMALGRQGR